MLFGAAWAVRANAEAARARQRAASLRMVPPKTGNREQGLGNNKKQHRDDIGTVSVSVEMEIAMVRLQIVL